MITQFKIFEKLIIGDSLNDYVKGVLFADYDIFMNCIKNIIKYFKLKKIEYVIFFNIETNNIHILFPKLVYYNFLDADDDFTKENDKFPINDSNDSVLPVIDEYGSLIVRFSIQYFYLYDIKNSVEIKIENDNDINNLDEQIKLLKQTKKFNL